MRSTLDKGLCWIAALLWAVIVDGANAACSYPGDIADATVIDETVKTSFAVGDILIYECNKLSAGHVLRHCLANDSWSDPSRSCDALQVWEAGAMAGVIVALLNYFVATAAILYAKRFPDERQDNKGKKQEDGMKIKQEPVTSKGHQ